MKTFPCPYCTQPILAEFSLAGQTIACPHCTHEFIAPFYCLKCSQSIYSNEAYCPACKQEKNAELKKFVAKKLITYSMIIGIPLTLFLTIKYNSEVTDASGKLLSLFLFIAFALLIIAVYFAPTIVGRHKQNCEAIFILNLFLGWTFLGWVIALTWALTKDNPRN